MKKRTLSLITAAALAALLMTGCAQAAAYNGRTTTAPQTGESTTTDDAVSVAPESTASAPVAAPASEPTTSTISPENPPESSSVKPGDNTEGAWTDPDSPTPGESTIPVPDPNFGSSES